MAIFNSWDLQDKTSELCLQSTNIPADTATIVAELNLFKPLRWYVRGWKIITFATLQMIWTLCHAQNKLSLFNPIGFYLGIAVRCNTYCLYLSPSTLSHIQ